MPPAMTVARALEVPPLRGADPEVVAGRAGLDRLVRWVHTTELVDVASLLRGGDLVLSTGIALPDVADDLAAFATSLEASDAAGLVIELGRRWTALPQALAEACERVGLPLVALRREVRFAAVGQALGELIVHEQLTELREAQRVHDVFTELGLAGAGPPEVLATTQRLAGGTVVLEDAHHRVVDHRPGTGDGDFLADWQRRSRAVRLDGRTAWDASSGWLVTRVGPPGSTSGRLVVRSDGPPPAWLVATAERAAAALTLHDLHDRPRVGLVRRAHTELLAALLRDPPPPDVAARCELAGLPVHRRTYAGLAVRPVEPGRGGGVDAVLAAVVHAVHEARVPALVAALDGDVRVLLSLDPSADPEGRIEELAGRVHRRTGVVVAAGAAAADLGAAGRSLREAVHVADAVRAPGTGPAVHRLADVHLRGLLSMLGDDDRVRTFVDRELARLRAHDAAERSGLLDAVRALVRHPGSKSDAAASLHMSRPAFYDRLAKVERLLGVDLDDPDVRVSLHVALLADEVVSGG
jgi:PucR family transcriptional regulator, purine catabolism regulatory protein